MKKISIVVPVYNAEKYLRRCYESLRGQTHEDIEIVFVNDGSTDGSLAILQQFAREDRRVRIVDQENRGTLLARKNGVAATTGDWCLFADPDDWLELTACQTLADVAREGDCDIVAYGAFVEGGAPEDAAETASLESWLNSEAGFIDGPGLAVRVFAEDAVSSNLWNKLVRGGLCREAFAAQPDVVATFAEDQYAFLAVAEKAGRGMKIIGDRLYHYQLGEGIATRKDMSVASFRRALNAVDLAQDAIERYQDAAAAHFGRRALAGLYDAIRRKVSAGQRASCLDELCARSSREAVADAVQPRTADGAVVNVGRIERLDLLFADVPVTVVVPVYNVEKYLRDCLDSVLAQTHPSIEIICVNDGSTDGSRKILDEYPQVRVIDQKNAGLGAARNVGLAAATGKYVYFLDSDDKIVPEAIACLTALAERENLDQVVFGADPFTDSEEVDVRELLEERRYQRIPSPLCNRIMAGPEFLKRALPLDLTVSQPVRFFRREFLMREGLRYPEGILHEDNVFAWKSACLSKRICAIERRFFLRRIRGGSIMHSADNGRLRSDGYLHNIECALAFNPFWDGGPELRRLVLRYCIGPLFANAARLSGLDLRLTDVSSESRAEMSFVAALSYLLASVLPWGLVLAWKKTLRRPLPQQAVFTRRCRRLKYLFPYGFIRYWMRRKFGDVYD